MPHSISILEPTKEDLQPLVLLFDAYRVFYKKPSDLKAAEAFLSDRLFNKDSQLFVAKDPQGKAVGFVQLYPLFSSTGMQRLWLLNDLYVQPEYRGRGISKLLIERSKQWCKETQGCGLLLETEKSNAIGNALYTATGFSRDEDHHYYFWNNG